MSYKAGVYRATANDFDFKNPRGPRFRVQPFISLHCDDKHRSLCRDSLASLKSCQFMQLTRRAITRR